MVKENIIIPKENIAKVEEVREIENKQQEPTIAESAKEAVVPTVYASNSTNEEVKEGLKDLGGVASAATLGVGSIPLKIVGKAEQGIGKTFGSGALKEMGEVHNEGANKPAEWLGEIGKGIKKAFD